MNLPFETAPNASGYSLSQLRSLTTHAARERARAPSFAKATAWQVGTINTFYCVFEMGGL